MKKFLVIALIAATFTACNDGEKTDETTISSDTTTTVVPNPADTIQQITTTTVDTVTKVKEGDDDRNDTTRKTN